jgi:hypothetical protein
VRHALRHRDDEPLGAIDDLAREAVEVEAEDAADVFAKIVAAFPARAAVAAVSAPYMTTRSPARKRDTPGPTAATSPAASTP